MSCKYMRQNKKTKEDPGSLSPLYLYLMFTESHIVHQLTLFNYKRFSKTTIQKLQQNPVIMEEVVIIRSLCNSTHQDQMEEEVSRLLILAPDDAN